MFRFQNRLELPWVEFSDTNMKRSLCYRPEWSESLQSTPEYVIGCLRKNLVGLRLSSSVSYVKSIPTHEKLLAVGTKKWTQNATFNLVFLGLGWP